MLYVPWGKVAWARSGCAVFIQALCVCVCVVVSLNCANVLLE